MSRTATLHILNKSPDHRRTTECLAQIRAGDTLVLTENAVFSLVGGPLQALPANVDCVAIDADMQARGISAAGIVGAKTIDYNALVQLTVEHRHIINW